MFVDTHCHLNMMVKKEFDVPFEQHHYFAIDEIISQACQVGVTKIINVGTQYTKNTNFV